MARTVTIATTTTPPGNGSGEDKLNDKGRFEAKGLNLSLRIGHDNGVLSSSGAAVWPSPARVGGTEPAVCLGSSAVYSGLFAELTKHATHAVAGACGRHGACGLSRFVGGATVHVRTQEMIHNNNNNNNTELACCRAATGCGATVNVRTEEATEVLAVCLYHKEKLSCYVGGGVDSSAAAF